MKLPGYTELSEPVGKTADTTNAIAAKAEEVDVAPNKFRLTLYVMTATRRHEVGEGDDGIFAKVHRSYEL